MDARQLTGGVGVTTVIAILTAAAIGTVLSGFAVTTLTGVTNRLGFNASTLASSTTSLVQRVTGVGLQQVDHLPATAVALEKLDVPRRRSSAVCLSEVVLPDSANLNLAFKGVDDTAVVEGQLHGGRLRNVSYPMLVLSSTPDCSAGLKRSSHLAHYPLTAAVSSGATLLEVPRGPFNAAVLDDERRTVWLHADGRPLKDACCMVRRLA